MASERLEKLKRPKPGTAAEKAPAAGPETSGPKTSPRLAADLAVIAAVPVGPVADSKKPRAETVTFQCGHARKREWLASGPCPTCQAARAKERRRESRARWEAARANRPLDTPGRLPDGSLFSVEYDAATQTWGGYLTVPNLEPPLYTAASGVFKLLKELDRLYREAAGIREPPPAAAAPPPGANTP